MSNIEINNSSELENFLTQDNNILSNITIIIKKNIVMNKKINNKSFTLNNVIFNGLNRTIKDLNLTNPLFSSIDSNSKIENVLIDGFFNVFINTNNGTINDCNFNRVMLNNLESIIITNNGTISKCEIINSNYRNNKADQILGLLCKENAGTIDSCASRGNTINNNVSTSGGLVGSNSGTIEKCYIHILDNNSLFSGGLVGIINNNSKINNIQINKISLSERKNATNGLIFGNTNTNNFSISCIMINKESYDKYIKNDTMNNYKNNIKNIQVNNNYIQDYNIDNSSSCFKEGMRIREGFLNLDSKNIFIYLIILFLIICIIVYFLKFYKK